MPASLAIHRLSARTPARAQPVAARLALQALGADLEDALPRGLPPQALLWLRRLQLQAPEAALLRPAPAVWRQDWIAAGRQQMDAALAQAARPALGPVPESAPAVLFADAAEMLACLALAAQAGQMDRWWWRGLLGRAWPHAQAAWAARPQAQEAAVRLLVKAGQGGAARAWSAGLQEAQASQPRLPVAVSPAGDVATSATPRVVTEPGALQASQPGNARATMAPVASALEPPPATRPGRESPRVVDTTAPLQAPRSPAEPLAATADADPVEPSAVPPGAASMALVVLADDLQDSPAPTEPAQPATPPRVRSAHAVRSDKPVAHPSRKLPLGEIRATPVEVAAPVSLQPPAATPVEKADAESLVDRPSTEGRAVGRESVDSPTTPPAARTVEPVPREPVAAESPAPLNEPATPWPWPQAVLSRQAPLLFIVNALLEDGLYPDFTRPRDPGLPVPLWALLPALARAWRLPADELQSALQSRCLDWTAPDAMPAVPGTPAGPWPDWLAAYARSLRRRLCRRLGLRPVAWPQALKLARPARLWLSEAELVAEFDLGAHDVAWRLAGLDRDPGWLPSAGCSLRFVFVA